MALYDIDFDTELVIDAVLMEQERAYAKHGPSGLAMADCDVNDPRFWWVCIEEVGEVARAMQDEGPQELYDELVQTVAMFLHWAVAAKRQLDSEG